MIPSFLRRRLRPFFTELPDNWPPDAVVLHGSAVRHARDRSRPFPRDLDVVVSGRYSDTEAELLAHSWARRVLKTDRIAVDLHRNTVREELVLPTPVGVPLAYALLAGRLNPAALIPHHNHELTGLLRLSAFDPEQAAKRLLTRLRTGQLWFSLEPGVVSDWPLGDYANEQPRTLSRALRHAALPALAAYGVPADFVGFLTTLHKHPGWDARINPRIVREANARAPVHPARVVFHHTDTKTTATLGGMTPDHTPAVPVVDLFAHLTQVDLGGPGGAGGSDGFSMGMSGAGFSVA